MSSMFRTIELQTEGPGPRRRGVGTCRSCGRKIVWAKTAAGKNIPFDEMPEALSKRDTFETVSTEHIHWATCPSADQHRKRA